MRMTDASAITGKAAGKAICALLAGAAFAGLATSAFSAQSLREIRAQRAEESALQDQAGYTMQLCKIDFAVSIDWPSFGHWPEGADVAAACDRGLSEIENECRKGAAPRVARFVCTGDGTGSDYRGSTLTYGASPR